MARQPDRSLQPEEDRLPARYLDEDDEHYDPPPGRKLEILWQEYKYRLKVKADRSEQMKVYGWWVAVAAGLATAVTTIIGNLPWPKAK